MQAIFISYRREDAEGQAGRLFDDLVRQLGPGSVFMDVAGIEPGRDFRQAIDDQVASCQTLVAVIGNSWLNERLNNPDDFVRLEIASALKRGVPVIPVLVRGATMPRADQLPADLAPLAYRRAVELSHTRWDSDVQLLIDALRPLASSNYSETHRRLRNTAFAFFGVFLAVVAGYAIYSGLAEQSETPPPSTPPIDSAKADAAPVTNSSAAGPAKEAQPNQEKRDLEIVNVSLRSETRPRSDHDLVVDIQLRNRGAEVAFITEAVLQFTKVAEFRSLGGRDKGQAQGVEVSKNYTVRFAPQCVPYTRTVPISQKVGSNDVDRFLLTISASHSLPLDETVYRAGLELVYNGDKRKLRGPDLLMILPEDSDVHIYEPSTDLYGPSPAPTLKRHLAALVALNRRTALAVSKSNGEKSPYLSRVLAEILRIPVDTTVTASDIKQASEASLEAADKVQVLADARANADPCSN